ncbi:MAG TPA: hypothetical protein VE621_18180, partial [Bryobacteraceae bacterium]|nr:hypothetical protein [Bryobacteraceae bacterium]
MESIHQNEGTAVAPALQPEPPAPVITTEEPTAPVDRAERITAIDSLRGFALLGILLMNIVAMGMNGASYDNPTVTGGATGINLAVWAGLHVLAEGKMRCLFSLVFGASVILLTSRLEKRGSSADIYYRRTFWLMLFGIVHAYLLWFGDILYPYALCGLLLYPFRKMSVKGLLIIGTVLLVIQAGAYIGMSFDQKDTIEKGRAAIAAEKSGATLTDEQKKAKEKYEKFLKFAHPDAATLKKDIDRWRGNPLEVIKARAEIVGKWHSMPYYGPWNWDVWSMMFIGMALMKLGLLNATKPARTYVLLAVIGLGIGIPVNSYSAWTVIKSNFDPVVQAMSHVTYDLGRLSV